MDMDYFSGKKRRTDVGKLQSAINGCVLRTQNITGLDKICNGILDRQRRICLKLLQSTWYPDTGARYRICLSVKSLSS